MIRSGQQYEDERFENEFLENGESLSGRFNECIFVNCCFSGVLIHNTRFHSCKFLECDLALLDITGSSFPSTEFKKSKLIGINWTRADWSASRIGVPPVFLECVLNHGTFIGVKFKGTSMLDCIARDVDFREADLSDVVFGKTDFSGTIFGNTDLSGADFSKACNYSIDPAANTLKGTRFSLPEAISLLYEMDIVLEER